MFVDETVSEDAKYGVMDCIYTLYETADYCSDDVLCQIYSGRSEYNIHIQVVYVCTRIARNERLIELRLVIYDIEKLWLLGERSSPYSMQTESVTNVMCWSYVTKHCKFTYFTFGICRVIALKCLLIVMRVHNDKYPTTISVTNCDQRIKLRSRVADVVAPLFPGIISTAYTILKSSSMFHRNIYIVRW